jgi:hypothetical protein
MPDEINLDLVEPTPEPGSAIAAAYDSVGLCNTIIAENATNPNKTQENLSIIERNRGHLSIMMGKDWFIEALTPQQTIEINECIAACEVYLIV